MQQIDRETLRNMIDKKTDMLLIDARRHEAYDKEHLPGAVSIPSDHIGRHLLKSYRRDRTFVTYCSGWKCEASTMAAKKLESYGFNKVLDFKGGLEDWKDAGYGTERG